MRIQYTHSNGSISWDEACARDCYKLMRNIPSCYWGTKQIVRIDIMQDKETIVYWEAE